MPAAWLLCRPLGDRVPIALVLAVFLANAFASLAVPPTMGWSGGPVQHYVVHLVLALTGLPLLVPPVASVLSLLGLAEPVGFSGTASALWLLAVAAFAAVMRGFPAVPWWRRGLYAYLVAAQLTGFAAVHWSTLGD